jgi:hypothetical protein
MSDHTPLLLQGELDHHHNTSFRFENFWTEMEGFQDLVQTIWNRPVTSVLPMKRLHIKMVRVAKGIKRWKKEKNWRHKTAASYSERNLAAIRGSTRAKDAHYSRARFAPPIQSSQHGACGH